MRGQSEEGTLVKRYHMKKYEPRFRKNMAVWCQAFFERSNPRFHGTNIPSIGTVYGTRVCMKQIRQKVSENS